jgi:hypothetical protein
MSRRGEGRHDGSLRGNAGFSLNTEYIFLPGIKIPATASDGKLLILPVCHMIGNILIGNLRLSGCNVRN